MSPFFSPVSLLLFSLILLSSLSPPSSAHPTTVTVELHHQFPRLVKKPSPRGFHSHLRLFSPQTPSLHIRLLRFLRLSSIPSSSPSFVSRSVSVDLLGGITKVGEYYTRIYVGGQPIRVQVDTGSSTTALPVAECDNCLPSDQRYDRLLSTSGQQRWVSCLNPLCLRDICSSLEDKCGGCSSKGACCSAQNTDACAFFLSYGDGSGAEGGLMIDTMSWGNVTAPVVFGAILHDTVDFERPYVDGILGMAYKALACNPTCVEPPFQQMVQAGVVEDQFSICITQQGGKLILGDFDHSLATSSVSYVPLALSTPPTFYSMNVSNVLTVGSRTLELPNFQSAILDSGTTLVVISEVNFKLILQHLRTFYCDVPGLCEEEKTWFLPSQCVDLPKSEIDKLPTIVFHLGDGDFDLEMRPEDYMLHYISQGKAYRCVGIMMMPSGGKDLDMILGNTIMQRYVTHYDRAGKRLGFAEAKPGCGGPSHCSSYTSCSECAAAAGCSFDFRDLKCRESRGGFGFVPYPECAGGSCFCNLGPQTGLVFGVAAGMIASSLVVVMSLFVVTIYRRRGRAGSVVGNAVGDAPIYSVDEEDEVGGGEVQASKRYLPVPPE